MEKSQSQKAHELLLKKEMEMIKREERSENVARIAKAQKFKRDRIKEKIEYDYSKAINVKREKEKLLEKQSY